MTFSVGTRQFDIPDDRWPQLRDAFNASQGFAADSGDPEAFFVAKMADHFYSSAKAYLMSVAQADAAAQVEAMFTALP